ncbi:hypothetical protein [Latilactobacillus curvatus]|uniref:hypothetical protein n=1 Tax=Latilactobacillus curvatus TaxID=28038 RepID=UPI003C2E15CD
MAHTSPPIALAFMAGILYYRFIGGEYVIMTFLGLEVGSWADWVSGIATSGGILYTIWLNKERKRPKVELTTYLRATKEGELAHNLTERTLVYEVVNNSEVPIRVKRLGVKFTSDSIFKKKLTSENVKLVEDGRGFQTIAPQESYSSEFFFVWYDYFPKKNKFIRAYPYAVLKNNTVIKSRKYETYYRNAFGNDRT